ncbi:X8 [Macleaya cordata]|uniref:X8 n=1 Tax=Macleaya cordata TaxID=56857 RepID=A0A200QD06_MACCD|nr:X8 [Macleaya cordata]
MAAATTKVRWREVVVVVMLMAVAVVVQVVDGASWCVARSNASEQALQTALDYACWAGADCAPIQPPGLCYLPNNLIAHASYAFNSYYQRRYLAAGACDFAGTATIAMTDPSYGSCVYPSSPSNAGGGGGIGGGGGGGGIGGGGGGIGGTITPTTPIINNPNTPMTPMTPSTPIYGGVGGFTPGLGPTTAGTTYGSESPLLTPSFHALMLPLILVLVFSLLFKPYELY